MRIPLAKDGIRELAIGSGLFGGAAVCALVAFGPPLGILLALIPALGLAFTVSFFRDPDRELPPDESLVVSPADGTVADIIEVPHHPFMEGPAWRVGIFLSVFNVHVNRAPLKGTVELLHYKPGGYLDARDPEASEENEAQDLGLRVQDAGGNRYPVLVRQIAGLVARRIVCRPALGQELLRGERFGMIKFGSRTEIFLPVERTEAIDVRIGQKLRGGFDVVARLKTPVSGGEVQ
jgi:phosphatidylserine decarboxylase